MASVIRHGASRWVLTLLSALLVASVWFPTVTLRLAQMASVIRSDTSRCALTLLSYILVCCLLATGCGHLSVEAVSITTITPLLHCIVPLIIPLVPPVPARMLPLLLCLLRQLLLSGLLCVCLLMRYCLVWLAAALCCVYSIYKAQVFCQGCISVRGAVNVACEHCAYQRCKVQVESGK